MTDLLPFLKNLISAPGLSGHEGPVRDLIAEAWEPLTNELSTSRVGSLHGLRRGDGPEPRPNILLATHMDAIGLMVTKVVDGFLHLTEVGGVDHRVLPGQIVTVHGREDLPGLIVQPPSHLLPEEAQKGPVPLENLFVDTGLLPDEVEQKVRTGDLVSFAQEPIEMGEDFLVGHTLDNRASVAALTDCLATLQNRRHAWDFWAVATVQEEETLAGALTSAYQLEPDLAIAIDVTFAQGPGSPKHKSFAFEKGITLGWGPNIHPGLHQALKEAAGRFEIPYQKEAMPRHSGTDALALQIARAGIPTMVVSIPLGYMHTPVEMLSLKNVRRAARLLANFVTDLEPDFIEKLSLKHR